jgi:hypothetical protein
MHKITFFPLGNADSRLIELAGGQKLLFDYANMYDRDDENDKRVDLATALMHILKAANRDYIDVVAFTHADDDHIHGASEFFYLEHAIKYQGKGRVRINELWVPAAMIVEEGAEDEARILRSEARHRLKQGKGIRVFSRPDRLKDWLANQNIALEDRLTVITDAGKIIPGFSKGINGVEFFVHSPFAKHAEGEIQDRNESALILHATFSVEATETRIFLIGDTTYEILSEIVAITRGKKRLDRLVWDVYDIPHHCSYGALGPEKGKEITEPDQDVKWMLDQGQNRCLLISSSDPIPHDDATQPPHKQAAEYYRRVSYSKEGEFLVTMEFPKKDKPQPIQIMIGNDGSKVAKTLATPMIIASQQAAPRAG